MGKSGNSNVFAKNTTIYAHWLGQAVTVTFNANGGTVGTTSKTVNYAASYGDLPTPVYNHHDFAGWYTAQTGGTKVTSSTQVSSTTNHNLYAHWTNTTYKITYNANGGTGTTLQQSFGYGTSVKIGNPNFYKEGKEFDCWNTQENGLGVDYAAGQTVTLSKENFTLYAKWKEPTTTLTAAASGSGLSGVQKIRVYDKFGNYHDYTSYENMVVYPGADILLFSKYLDGWQVSYFITLSTCNSRRFHGSSAPCILSVPRDATGQGNIWICTDTPMVVCNGEPYSSSAPSRLYSLDDSWASEMIHSSISEAYGLQVQNFASSGISPYMNIVAYDKYGFGHVYTDSDNVGISGSGCIVYPGCKVVFCKKPSDTVHTFSWDYINTNNKIVSLGTGDSMRIMVPENPSSRNSITYFNSYSIDNNARSYGVRLSYRGSNVTGWILDGPSYPVLGS